ncbi:AraC family transcriptional regulator [Morganella morganii]|uniref:AraC family transcriptional regulator n=1 Tax=Morganella morganii TaxID=582 RepID=UPI000BFBBCD5|nr:AraC family transcriptional regulator [Morganella morganii]EKU4287303.1 AraC family transcriptional regulator [Morganella morganii]EKU4303198.1 AraC family transcriptional regulator [Morganella morganii]EKU5661707.1 AraC family transcriptional regulator [Morganella morganii]EKU5689057.1 AraC family transcriptional regulator [Morganella morganii]EKU6424204.1 AraC family transcriptional regulator [Morganella morganii]
METDDRLRCLKQLLQTYTAERSGGWDTTVPGLALCRWTAPSQAQTWTYEPGIALAVQGAKRITLGDNTYCYRPGDVLLTSVDIPAIAQVCEASEQAPFLALLVSLNLSDLPVLMQESGFQLLTSEPAVLQAVCPVTEALLSAVCRLVALLEKPDDIPVMAPLIHKEILYYLLKSGQGARLQLMAAHNKQCRQISGVLSYLKAHFDQPVSVETLCRRAQMSESSFHRHFRRVTRMSPLQYQKWLRLNEARRLLLVESADASEAAFRVGYESASQFNREYRRLFGLPPGQDKKRVLL